MSRRQVRQITNRIFPIMLGVGAATALLCLKYFSGLTESWQTIVKNMMSVIKNAETEFQSIFFYVLIDRGREIMVLSLMNLTNLSVLYQGWYGWKTGFLFSVLCGICVSLYGPAGLAVVACLYFPHGFFLLYLIYLSSRYFNIYRRCHAGWKEWGKLIGGMTAVFLFMCLVESSVSVWLLKRALGLL
ncbi:MAG: hypothetical protein LUE29_13050 [Lachnospiraceae bacterium]|nr:hypothetical protein [Lachnospiraceae bacterium]